MTFTLALPAVIAVVGLLVYFLASKPELKETGRLVFFCGFFWFVYSLLGRRP